MDQIVDRLDGRRSADPRETLPFRSPGCDVYNPAIPPVRWQSGRMRQLAKLLNWDTRFRGFESRPHRQPRGARIASGLLLAAVALATAPVLAGCAVDRRLRIETDPPKAAILVDGNLVGESPLDLHFTHYGPRTVRAELPGRRIAEQIVDLDAPWYGWFPIDIVSEVILPLWRTDHRSVLLVLPEGSSEPGIDPATLDAAGDAAIERAWQFRRWVPGDHPPPPPPVTRP